MLGRALSEGFFCYGVFTVTGRDRIWFDRCSSLNYYRFVLILWSFSVDRLYNLCVDFISFRFSLWGLGCACSYWICYILLCELSMLLSCLLRPSLLSVVVSAQLGHNIVDSFCVGLFREALHRCQWGFFQIYFVIFTAKHTRVVYQNLFWKSLKDPIVLQRLQWCHAIHRIPVKALVNEVEEFLILAFFEHAVERLGVRHTPPTSWIGHNYWNEWIFFKEKVTARAQIYNVVRRHSLDFHNIR